MAGDILSTNTIEATADLNGFDLLRLSRCTTEHSPLAMVAVADEKHIICHVNLAFCSLVERSRDEVIGRSYAVALPEGKKNGFLALLDRVYATGQAGSISHQEHGGRELDLYWSYTAWPVLDVQGQPAGVLIQIIDTTEPVRTQRVASAINEALLVSGVRQHELAEIAAGLNLRMQRAMRETHHRVKNNLQIVSAIAELQMDGDSPTIPVSAMQRIAQHVRALADLHDLLSQQAKEGNENKTLDTQAVLHRLLPVLQATIGARRLNYEITPMRLPIDKSESLSLLVSELISNALKHGAGEITLNLERNDSQARLTVCDMGKGFPANFNERDAAKIGLELIMSMARHDLRGDVTFTNGADGGACVIVKFPIAP